MDQGFLELGEKTCYNRIKRELGYHFWPIVGIPLGCKSDSNRCKSCNHLSMGQQTWGFKTG